MTNDRFDPEFEAWWPTIWRDGNERSSTVFDAEIKRFAHTAYQHGFAVGSGDEGYYQREIERLRDALLQIKGLTSSQVTLHYHCRQANEIASAAL